MGTVLSFQSHKRVIARPPIAAASDASVIIFPGVRYERVPGTEHGVVSRRPTDLVVRPQAPPQP